MSDKEILEDEVVFEETSSKKQQKTKEVSKTEGFFQDNKNIIFGAIAALALIIIGVMVYKNNLETDNITAQQEMVQAVNYFERNADSLAIYGDGSNSGLEDIVDQYGSTVTGNLARFYLGLSFLRLGQTDEGVSHLEKYSSNGEVLSAAAFSALAYGYEEQQNFSKAARYYEKAASTPERNQFSTPVFLMDAARAYELDGNSSKALSTYKRIKSDFPNSQEGVEVDKYIARLSK